MSRRWHHGSLFGPGPRRPLSREQRARFLFLVDLHHRARRLTRAAKDIAKALLKRLGADGQLDPSYETLAADVGCSARTARRAMAVMRILGLLRWQTRLVRAGWRTEQTSNAYELLPSGVVCCGGHFGRVSPREEIPERIEGVLHRLFRPSGGAPSVGSGLLSRTLAEMKQRGSYTGD